MKHSLRRGVIASAIIALFASVSAAEARDLTIVSFGGNYQDAQREVYFKPFTETTGTPILEESWDGGIGVIAAKMETPPADWDVVQVETEELTLGCADGLYEEIDWEQLGGKDKFIDAAIHDCGVGTIVWSTAIAYDGDKLKDNVPQSWADFWDTEKFPGKRALRRGPKYALEFALIADGVPLNEVYEVLSTPEGVDRAFAKLDQIKDHIVWWESGAQPPQLLASGEVVMTSVYNGRLAGINKSEGKNFKLVWPGSIYAVDSWVIMKGSPNKDKGIEFIKFASEPEHQSKLPNYVDYGITNVEASKMVKPELAANLPTAPENLEVAIALDGDFWVDNIEELNERFNAWLAQ